MLHSRFINPGKVFLVIPLCCFSFFRCIVKMEVPRNRQIFVMWEDIQDIIGPAREWPYRIRRLFWTRNLNHFQRILVCSFCWVNGLNPLVLMEWMELMNQLRDGAAVRHVRALFRIFEERHRNYNLYAYNVSQGYYQYIDGRIRHYVPRNQRQ